MTFLLQYTVVYLSASVVVLTFAVLASVYNYVTFWLQYTVVLPFGFSIQLLPFGFSCCVTFWLQYIVVLPFGFSVLLL